MEVWKKICCWVVDLGSLGILLYLFVVSLVRTSIMRDGVEIIIYQSDSLIGNTAVIAAVVLCVCMLRKHMQWRNWYVWLYPATAVLYAVMAVYSVHSMYQMYDQLECATAAAGFLTGDYSAWIYGGYCYIWNNQHGFVLFLALLFRLFGILNYQAVYLVNIALYFGTVCLCRRLVGFRTKSRGLLLAVWTAMLFYYPAVAYVGFVYGVIPGLFFITLAFYLYVVYSRVGKPVVTAACMAGSALAMFAAVCVKSNYMIASIAIILVGMVRAVSERSFRQLLMVVIFGAAFAAAVRLPGIYVEHVTGNPADEGVPAIAWVEMGLISYENTPEECYNSNVHVIISSDGWWNNYNREIFIQGAGTHDLTQEVASEDLQKTIQFYRTHPAEAVWFFYRKTTSQWNHPDFYSHTLLERRSDTDNLLSWFSDEGSRYYSLYQTALDRIMSLVYFGALCFVVIGRRRSGIADRTVCIALMGGFLFHLVWEAKSQYAFPYFIMIIPCSVWGIWKLTDLFLKHCS